MEGNKECMGCVGPVINDDGTMSIRFSNEERDNLLKLMLRVKIDGNEAHEFVRLFDKVKYGR